MHIARRKTVEMHGRMPELHLLSVQERGWDMGTQKNGKVTAVIEMKLPSLNEYINVCRTNRYKAAKFKRDIEDEISLFFGRVPVYKSPVKIHFHWVEENKRRDLDNVCFAKKFILDALVKSGKLADDNRKIVTSFTDTFEYGKEAKVILQIEEIPNEA